MRYFRDLIILVLGFGGLWVLFIYVDIFPDEITTDFPIEYEEKLGEVIMDQMMRLHVELDDSTVNAAMQIINKRLLDEVGLTDYDFNIIVVESEMINAVTLPGANIIVFSGLLEFVESAEELSAVIAHEIGHVQNRDVVQKLAKDIGIEILIGTIGGADNVLIGELARSAGSTIFDRKQEREADAYALDLMTKARINPRVLGAFFNRMSETYDALPEELDFLSTHPNNNSRVKAAFEYKLPEGFEAEPFGINWDSILVRLNKSEFDSALEGN